MTAATWGLLEQSAAWTSGRRTSKCNANCTQTAPVRADANANVAEARARTRGRVGERAGIAEYEKDEERWRK